LSKLTACALEAGADGVRPVAAGLARVDPRVRLKCRVPRCVHYGRNLMCPPHAPSLEESGRALALYRHALLIHLDVVLPQTGREADLEAAGQAALRLHDVVHRTEAEALRLGSPLAAGFIGGHCRLCPECVAADAGEGEWRSLKCRHPFRARPSLEAVGVDVTALCAAAGVVLQFNRPGSMRWVGAVFI